MPEVVRPASNGDTPRHGGRHLWKGGHDPATARQALAVDLDLQIVGNGDRRRATASLTNIGADHDLQTGIPDRHLTVDFRLTSADGAILRHQRHTLQRTIMWRPFIIDLWDTRLPAGRSRTYAFEFRADGSPPPAALDVVIRYHLLDEARRKRMGYENSEPISYVVHQQRVPVP